MLTIRIVLLFSAVSLSLSATCGRSSELSIFGSRRIIGGNIPRQHSWPWIVSIHHTDLFDSTSFLCGGTLISEKYVLSAAHCFYQRNRSISVDDYIIMMGSHYINETNPIRMKIKSIRLHENYDDILHMYDIALIELICRVNLSLGTIGMICLPPKNMPNYPYKKNGIVIGWGSLLENGTVSHVLQQIQLPVISPQNETCRPQIRDNKTQFCAGLIEGGRDACQGDSGGPLMIYDETDWTWNVAGIISKGYGCARAEYPGVYTRVSMFVDWIEEHTNSSSMKKRSIEVLLLLLCIIKYF